MAVLPRNKFHFFWDGICSQWHPSKFVIGSVEYNCAEQFMMAMKAYTFGDHERITKIMGTDSPKIQKAQGRMVKNFDPEIWDRVSRSIVFRGNMAKFSQNPDMRDFLLSTDDRIIVEASPVDTIWGVGMADDDPDICDPEKWRGKNYLGIVCMEVREMMKLIRG